MITTSDVDFEIEGVIDQNELLDRQDGDTSLNGYLVLPDKKLVDIGDVIGRTCSDIFKNLPSELGIDFRELFISIENFSHKDKNLNGESLCYFRLGISQSHFADIKLSNSAFGRGLAVGADSIFKDIVLVRVADFQVDLNRPSGSSGLSHVECDNVYIRKSVFDQLRFERVSISRQLVIERCNTNAISLVDRCELNDLTLNGNMEANIAFDFKNVSLSKNANLLTIPGSLYPAIERLQKN